MFGKTSLALVCFVSVN